MHTLQTRDAFIASLASKLQSLFVASNDIIFEKRKRKELREEKQTDEKDEIILEIKKRMLNVF